MVNTENRCLSSLGGKGKEHVIHQIKFFARLKDYHDFNLQRWMEKLDYRKAGNAPL